MKNLLSTKILAALMALAILVLCLPAANAAVTENPNGYNAFSGAGTAQSTSNSFYVAGNYTLSTGTPVVRYLNVSSDLATSKVQFYALTNPVVIQNPTNSGTTNLICSSTNGFAAGNIVVIKHVLSDTYERLPLFAVQNTNQLVLKYPPITTCSPSDTLWYANPTGSIFVGATSNSVPTGAGSFIFSGQYGRPLLIEINGTSTATINAVSGDYR